MWRNPRLIGGAVLFAIILISQGVEQFTFDADLGRSRYPTPPLLARIVELIAVAMFTAGSLTEVARMWFSSKNGKSSRPVDEGKKDTEDDDPTPKEQEAK